ncbi:MAG: radical SAM protein [Spirochaetales bacterium]|nr:radical SAM protein [Spirochaetales bacterium]
MVFESRMAVGLAALESEWKEFFTSLGEKPFRATQAFHRLHRKFAASWGECLEFPLPLRQKLSEICPLDDLNILHSNTTEEGTEKVVFEARPDPRGRPRRLESVWIVSGERRTICISSQVGCSLNCRFCATATLPFQGNLSAAEILAQVYSLIRHRKELPTNIVFMGMGEPFYNYDAVLRAADFLHHPQGLGLGARHITISTAGVIPGIERFITEKRPYNLAISLNVPLEENRSALMDINERYGLKDLLQIAVRYTKELKRKITFEYIMMPDYNMDSRSLQALIRIARQLPCRINLIPLNTDFEGFRPPTDEEALKFQVALRQAGILAFNRGNPGKKINGACGMLALKMV